VARDDARAPAAGADERLDELGRRRVEVGARLVEQQHLGVVQHGAAHGQALDHPARVGVDLVVGARGSPTRSSSSRALERHAVQARVEGEVLAPAEVAVEQRRVAEQPDRARARPSPRRAASAEDARACPRAGAAASPARAAASTCPRRWGRRRRASRRPARAA
jgi:hypothetical protein